jgi:hypothetical protein
LAHSVLAPENWTTLAHFAEKIVAHKADYLLALKGNQPTLEGDVESYFGDAPASELVTKTAVEKGHGRIETRTYTASSNVDWIISDRHYPGEPRYPLFHSLGSLRHRAHRCRRARPLGLESMHWLSTSSSRTTSRDTAPATAPRTWRPSAASPVASCAPINQREASRHGAKKQAGIPTSSSKSCNSNDR